MISSRNKAFKFLLLSEEVRDYFNGNVHSRGQGSQSKTLGQTDLRSFLRDLLNMLVADLVRVFLEHAIH